MGPLSRGSARAAPWLWRAWVLTVGLLGLNCRDSTGPRSFAGRLAFAPTFESPTAGIVAFDRLRITLFSAASPPPGAEVLDTIIPIPAASDSIDLSLKVPLSSPREDMLLYLRLLNTAGDTVFRNSPYPQPVTVSSGPAALVSAPIEYVGVGFDAVSVAIGTPDTSVLFGDTLALSATAFGPSQQPIRGTPVAWRSLDSLRVRVPNHAVARVIGGPQRGPARIVAQLLTGPADTVIVTAQAVPATLTRVSGDSQTATPAAPLPIPLRVRVLGSDGLGVRVPVLFRALATGAAVSADTVLSDSLGYAEVTGTLGPAIGLQTFDATVTGVAGAVVFREFAVSGSVASVTLDRTVDTIARGASLQYTATARDPLGNPVSVTIGWTSTVPSVATVDAAGLAQALAVDSTKIIASAAGHADTARLYVRALDSVAVAPADTVITAIGDSFDLRATAYDNFGAVLSTGFVRKFISASPTVVTVNQASGRAQSVGAGNGVVIVRDSVDATLKVQAAATVRVNQVTASIRNTPALPDSLQVGVGGRRAIIAQALDRNNHAIPNKTFGFRSADPAVATVDAAGIVTGMQLNGVTFVVDSVDGFKDSVKVAVVSAPPSLLQWGFDSLAVGNGGSVSVPLTLSRTDPSTVRVLLSVIPATDTLVARPALGCPGGVLSKLSIAPPSSGTSVLFCGLKAGRVTVVAADSAGVFSPDTMVVTVVSTIEFREIGSFSQQPYFYANQNETYRAQVFLSDPAPAGGLGVTFVYGKPGTSAISPAPAIIPAGQLAADVVIQGLAPGTDSVIPTSGGFVGKFSRVYVAPNNLTLNIPYPYTRTLGVGQTFQPYVGITYAMDHILIVSASLSSGIGTVQSPDTIKKTSTGASVTVAATAPGKTGMTVTAPGWVSATDTLIFTTPRLTVSGQSSLIAGDPTLGYWSASPADSLRYAHATRDTLVVTAVSRAPSVVSVDSATLKLPPGSSGSSRYALSAQPAAGGDSAWIVVSAPGYVPDSFLVHVTKPTMLLQVSYPYTGRIGLGTLWKNAGYVQLPYVRPDTFTVSLAHTRAGPVRGPASIRVPAGQIYGYIDLVADSIGLDTLRVDTTLTPGYVISGAPAVYRVDSLHVRPFQYPGTTNYTIGTPYPVTAAVYDSADGQSRPLIAPLRVNLVSTNTATFTLDSGAVTIDSGQYYSVNHPDTLRFRGVDSAGARILASAPSALPDSSNLIKVFPTPLAIQLGYPYTVGRGLKLKNNYVYVVGGLVPDTVKIALRRFDHTLDTLTADTVVINKGQSSSGYFEVWALDSSRTDSIVATAAGYVRSKVSVTSEAASLLQGGLPATRLTTDLPYLTYVYTGTRSRYQLNPFAPISINVVSTDPNVMVIDSAFSINGLGDTAIAVVDTSRNLAQFRVRFVGSGTARLRYSAPGFAPDSTPLVSVTGPTLHLTTGNQTVGLGQILPNQYVYVDNPVTGTPLVVHLFRSDSTQPPAGQVFQLSVDSVTIPLGQTSSNTFEIIGNFANSAVLTARATAYSQSTATISVGAPQLVAPTTVSLSVGQAPPSYNIYTADQNGQQRIIAAALVVSASSSDNAVASVDSATITIPARAANAFFPIRPRAKGSVNVVFAAQGGGYKSDTTVVAVDTGQLSFGQVPTTLGPNQTAQMYVTLPFTNDSAVTVALGSTNQGVLTVPSSVVIPARSGSVFFTVTGVGAGSAAVTASAAIARSATSSTIVIGKPRLFISTATSANAGQRLGFTVYAEDSLGTIRPVTTPLDITLSSNVPAHSVFDATLVTVPANSSNVGAGVVFDTAGTYIITATAAAYAPGTATITTSGALLITADFSFTPQIVTIQQGQYVSWKNTGSVAHTSTSDTPQWNTNQIQPGQTSGPVYFGTAGSFTYHCAIHPTMTGTVTVNP